MDVTSDDEANQLIQWINANPLYGKCLLPTYHLRNIMDYNCSEGPSAHYENFATNSIVQYVKSTVDPDQYDAVGKFLEKKPNPQQFIMKMLTSWKVPEDLEVLNDDEDPPSPPKPSPTGATELDAMDLAAIGDEHMQDDTESVPDSYDHVIEESQPRDDSTPTGEEWENQMDRLKEQAWQHEQEMEMREAAQGKWPSDDKKSSF